MAFTKITEAKDRCEFVTWLKYFQKFSEKLKGWLLFLMSNYVTFVTQVTALKTTRGEEKMDVLEQVEQFFTLSHFETVEAKKVHGIITVDGFIHVDRLPYQIPEEALKFVDSDGFIRVIERYDATAADSIELISISFSWE